MKNSYLVILAIILVLIIGFIFKNKKTEAPKNPENKVTNMVVKIEEGSYKLDIAKSVINWKGEKITGANHEGTLKIKNGYLNLSKDMVSGEFVIDMNTINSTPDQLVAHLKSEDFFSVEKFPEAKFIVKNIKLASSDSVNKYIIEGDLVIKNITKPISFVMDMKTEDNTIKASGSFAINRADWEIKFGSNSFFKNLGDKAIRDAVEIRLDLMGVKVIQ